MGRAVVTMFVSTGIRFVANHEKLWSMPLLKKVKQRCLFLSLSLCIFRVHTLIFFWHLPSFISIFHFLSHLLFLSSQVYSSKQHQSCSNHVSWECGVVQLVVLSVHTPCRGVLTRSSLPCSSLPQQCVYCITYYYLYLTIFYFSGGE